MGVAARPGSGLGLLPAALSAQPAATLGALAVATLAGAAHRIFGNPAGRS
jgi:hypothetical protein